MSPNQILRLDSDHAQSDGKSVNRGPSILVPRAPVSFGHMVGETEATRQRHFETSSTGDGNVDRPMLPRVRDSWDENALLNERCMVVGFRSAQEATLYSAVII